MNQQRQFQWPMPQPQVSPLPEHPSTSYPLYQIPISVQPASMPSQQWRELPQVLTQTEQKSRCRRCGKNFSFFDRFGLAKKTHWCRTCSNQIQQALQRFRGTFLEITSYRTLNKRGWNALQRLAAQERLDMAEALAFIHKDAVVFIQRVVTQAEINSLLTGEVEQHIYLLLKILAIQPEIAQAIVRRVTEIKRRANIKL